MLHPVKVKISTPAQILATTLKIIGARSIFLRKIRNPNRSKKGFLPKGLLKSYMISTLTVASKAVVTFQKKHKDTAIHIIFLHGGSWNFEATKRHWILAKDIAEKSSCRVTMVDYPLAPEHSYKETFQMVKHTYLMLTEKYAGDKFVLMGDSAGGNIALAFVQKLINEKYSELPVRNILFSPALDLTFSNPQIPDLEHLDYILSRELLIYGAARYANGDDLNLSLLSPINGDLENLPETDIFYSTHELLMPDIQRFQMKAEKSGARINVYKYEGMQHDWVLFPIPERQKALKEVIGIMESLNN